MPPILPALAGRRGDTNIGALHYTRDHSRHSFSCKSFSRGKRGASRDVARVVSGVSVLCPRTVRQIDNISAVRLPGDSLDLHLD